MLFYCYILLFLSSLYIIDAGYGVDNDVSAPDIDAPAYVPSYLKYQNSKSGYGTKIGYTGTKTGYMGTKNGYTGTKTGYTGTKTSYTYGTKSGYGNSYTGSKSWSSGSHEPNFEIFKENANRPYSPVCDPECKNNGICVSSGTCQCPPNFYGQRCQFERKPCLTFPPLPMNSKRKCSSEICTITCMEGHEFVDGSTVANMRCVEGQWQPSRADFTTIPDCNPTCSPPCVNGGACLSLNTCQCPQDYRGPQCQYAASACDVRKLGFNGAYNCYGDGEKFSCKLSCPSGSTYTTTPANEYTCLYSTGTFLPQPIPMCQFESNRYVIKPSGHHMDYNTSKTYYETSYESSQGKHRSELGFGSYGHGIYGQESHGYGHGSLDYGPSYEQTQQVVIEDLTPKQGTCFTWGSTHYKTFDGKIYSFQSPCQHVLVRDHKDHKFTVALRQGECKRRYYCPSEMTIFLEDKEYVLFVGEEGGVSFRSSKRLLPIPATLPGIRVSMPRDFVLITLDTLGVDIKWDTNNLVIVDASIVLWNNTEGLCGKLDGVSENDLMTKDGKMTTNMASLAASWQLNKIGDLCDSSPSESTTCSRQSPLIIMKANEFCAKMFSKEKFRKCSKIMDVTLLLEACQWDFCSCVDNLNPEECACSTIAVFAKECLNHGVEEMRKWRDPDTCPMKCPEGKIYKACGPETQPSCLSPLVSAAIDNITCVEGCFCPEGLLLEEGRCVPKEQCPCRLRAKSFLPGAVVPKDCNTCTCQSGEWICTKVPCGARCGAVGDPHYTTFDGLRYDFMGHCTYTLIETTNLTIEVENVACNGAISEAMNLSPQSSAGKPSCTKAATIKYGGANINLKQGGFIIVNGKEVPKLPAHVGEILIRAASSLFVIVQLPNKVDIWWDGNTRVFVDVPPEFHDKTKGLCGTFNLNQKDDFLTPEGDVEQTALAFANKWKTREFCDDIQIIEPEHPCKTNVENKETAEKYCSKLKSKLFESCRWYVDVEPYYEDCLYDMCACEGDVSRCLCPLLGNYAMACAKAGVQIQWRYNIKECELSCTGGQQYTVCADSCKRTCSDVALNSEDCKPCCVEGCACAPGSVLDENNECVVVAMCPCYYKGLQFNPGYKEVRPGKRERELCTCTGARWVCRPATALEIKEYPPAEDLRLNCNAAQHQVFTTCEVAEPLTCKNMHLAQSSTTAECRPGCQCMAGYVLDTSSKQCVLPTACPCHHGGRSYADGFTMQEECNACICKGGNWTCTQKKCSGVCSTWGDSHFTTFDGKDYDFEGVCTYLMAKGVMETGKDGFVVEVQNVPCGTTGATCSKAITLKVGNGDNAELVSLSKDSPLPDISKLKRINLRLAGSFVFLDVPSLGMSLQWDKGTRLYIKVDPMWSNRVKGLCGNYNMDVRDDFQTPSSGGIAETSTLIFADSWKLKPTCAKTEEVRDHCTQRPERKEWATTICSEMKRHPFSLCHSEVSPSDYVTRCERDACACDSGEDCVCACTALAAYAQHCATRGITIKWRTKELCPMQCDKECSNYDACISPCPHETCDNTVNYEEIQRSCEKDSCIEGCKLKNTCPIGSVFSNSSLTECVPRASCRPVCMVLEDGRQVLEGEVIEEDACHTCRCSQKERVCTGLPCTTEAPTIVAVTAPTVSANEPLKCESGWTPWINRNHPETQTAGDTEPLPEKTELQIGQPMCSPNMATRIECRTVDTKKTAKETGLDAECSLERGLVCKGKGCADFEIRVYCQCEEINNLATSTIASMVTAEEPFQCLNSIQPNHKHPTDCHKFYECTPDPMDPNKPHAVLKTCGESMMYNSVAMVCDWPDSVKLVRPECDDHVEGFITTAPVIITTTASVLTTKRCPQGQIYADCAYPCDKLCDHFKKTLIDKGKCTNGEECVSGCIDESISTVKCDFGALWRDERTCVPVKDCTCYGNNGTIIKPNGIDVEGCLKCQCLDNAFHCDNSECIVTVIGTDNPVTREPIVSTERSFTSPVIVIKSTASPPPECSEDRYINLLWSLPIDPNIKYTASTSAGTYFEPQNAELNGRPHGNSAGSWNPSIQDKNQYIQVELPRREAIYGVKLQGSPLYDQYVTSYELMYGDDGNTFHDIDGVDGNPKVFRGPSDNVIISKQMLEPPIEAKYIRLRPLSWHSEIAVRLELIGCEEPSTTYVPVATTTAEPNCIEPIGLEAGLPVDYIEVSSNTGDMKYLNLHSERGWKPLYSTPGEWIMWDLTGPRNITAFKTKGGRSGWVTGYHVMYASDLSNFHLVTSSDGTRALFPGNFDATSVVINQLRPPLRARYIKIVPVTWHNNMEIRAEPIGCFETLIFTTTVSASTSEFRSTSTPVVSATCQLCPGVLLPSSGECDCSGSMYYDGESCTERVQCPCIVGYMTYGVGSTFRGSNCDECVCKLGGITKCKPVKECLCDLNLLPKLTSTCECTCEECPEGTRLCPTSKTCLPLVKWCDGVQDCGDDERDCTTTVSTTFAIQTSVAPTLGSVVTTTAAPVTKKECPVVECPPGYFVRYTSLTSNYKVTSISELPPPRPRKSYQRYFKEGTTAYNNAGFTKTGFSKTGSAKGGFPPPLPRKSNQAFTLDKPSIKTQSKPTKEAACPQFKCLPKLPPPPTRPGVTEPPVTCSTPKCPPNYSLKLDTAKRPLHQCPNYFCVPPPERPVFCNVTGRTFNTFDGAEYKYDICFHILARDNRFDAWTVLVRKKCRVDACHNELIVRQDEELILVKPNMMIEYDNYEYTVEQTAMICFQKNSFDISRLGNGIGVKSRRYNFTVFYYSTGDVKIGISKSLLGTVDGLCGAFDGDMSNDRRLPNGQQAVSIEEFGRSWARPGLSPNACQTKVIPPHKQKRAWELCDVITKEPLSHCEKILNLDKWRSICLEKVCECAELVVNGTKKTEEQCRCELLEQFIAECLAGDKDVELGNWRIDLKCPADCPPPLVHYDCYRRKCEPTCSSLGAVSKPCPVEDGPCFPGCYCPEGKLRKGDLCVTPTDCRDCVCNGLNNPSKYMTFERDDLPFSGNCTFIAARDRNNTGHHKFQVFATNGPCDENYNVVCTKSIHLVYEKNILKIYKEKQMEKLQVTINGIPVFEYPLRNEWVTITKMAGQDISVLVPDVQLELSVMSSKLEYSVRVPSYVYSNLTEGLCGICAGYQEHLILQNGTVAEDLEQYGMSWQASPKELELLDVPQQDECGERQVKCVIPSPENDICYNIYNKDKFGACHALVDPQSYAESCQQEVCLNNRTDLCVVLEKYATECQRVGVCLQWRSADMCPYTCELPLVYRPCVDCQLTCDNYEKYIKEPSLCDKPAAEGCYCPEEKVRVNNTCIEPTKCYPCDAEKLHYAGDEWQVDACTSCKCTKLPNEDAAHVSCTTQTCTTPTCDFDHILMKRPEKLNACCPEYTCMPKPQDMKLCDEPKKIQCGFGQVLKKKTIANGCKEFACECKPPSECDAIPQNDEPLEAGMERQIDDSGCCPVAKLVCKKDMCPKPEACPKFYTQKSVIEPEKCCPKYECELPKDKCIVTLEWEAAPKGGEKPRTTPETMFKDIDAAWLDGPCRSCKCENTARNTPETRCSIIECASITSTPDYVMEPRLLPFQCCPVGVASACRDKHNIYKVSENWTNPDDVCEMYKCIEVEDGKLEKVITIKTCDVNCRMGWKYLPSSSGECCGKCHPVSCVVGGVEKKIGETWTSSDHCINYTCVDVGGDLQVQSSNETCAGVEKGMKEKFVIEELKMADKCCAAYIPVACRVDNETYSEGDTWQSDDPCKNMTCGRDSVGRLTHLESLQTCNDDCALGYEYEQPKANVCCGYCKQTACIVDGEVRSPGTKWQSVDNCTQYECVATNDSVQVSSTHATCPDISGCDEDDIYIDGCCQKCRERSHGVCTPEPLSNDGSSGVLKIKLGRHGLCVNDQPLHEFKECRGSCMSGTIYNNQTGSHDTKCECCAAVKYKPLVVSLKCADGTRQEHRVATPIKCACLKCGETSDMTTTEKYNSQRKFEYPEIDARFKQIRK